MKKIAFLVFFGILTVNAQPTADSISEFDSAHVFRTVETQIRPELEGGMYKLSMYISQNVQLPEVHNRKISLFVSFIVEIDGTLSDVNFIHLDIRKLYDQADETFIDLNTTEMPIYDELKSAALNAITNFNGKWIPAQRDGVAVRCRFNYPIIINIE